MNHRKDLPSASIGRNELGNNDGLNYDNDFGNKDSKLKMASFDKELKMNSKLGRNLHRMILFLQENDILISYFHATRFFIPCQFMCTCISHTRTLSASFLLSN